MKKIAVITFTLLTTTVFSQIQKKELSLEERELQTRQIMQQLISQKKRIDSIRNPQNAWKNEEEINRKSDLEIFKNIFSKNDTINDTKIKKDSSQSESNDLNLFKTNFKF